MELMSLCCSSLPCHRTSTLNWKIVDKKPRHPKLFNHTQAVILCAGSSSKWNLGFSCQEKCKSQTPIGGSQISIGSAKLSQVLNCYVAEGDMGLRNVSRKADPAAKVLIPSLPDEPSGNCSSLITSCFWEWKPKLNVHYEKAGMENVNSPALLFLPGFGVGSFHYEKQLKDLGREYRVWALDFLGQGRSLPAEDPAPPTKGGYVMEDDEIWGFGEEPEPWAEELVYSIDLWQEQVYHFINQITFTPGTPLDPCLMRIFWCQTPDRRIQSTDRAST